MTKSFFACHDDVMNLTLLAKVFKVFMSLVALLVGAVAGAAMAGQLAMSPGGISCLEALGGVLMTFGFQPVVVSVATAQKLGYLSLLIAATQTVHGVWLNALMLSHPHVTVLFHLVGLAGIVMGFLARNPVPSNEKFQAKLDRQAAPQV